MQTITPERMLHTSIGIFLDSVEEEVSLLMSSTTTTANTASWLREEQTCSRTLDAIHKNVTWLEALANQLSEIKASLTEKALTVELRLGEGDPAFTKATRDDVENCLVSAYGIKPSPADIGPAYFAVLIRSDARVIACALTDFRPFPDNEFVTRMESVAKPWQRQKVATELFRFIESSTRFLMKADGFVLLNASDTGLAIKSCVDNDAPEWHTEMMLKFGFEQEEDGWGGDVAFFKNVE